MIKVKRGNTPDIFTRRNSPALKEKKLAEQFYSQHPLPKEAFEFKFYSNRKDEYKDLLIATFNARCAYCECFVMTGQRGDVEHFRPKGKYTRRDGSIAYPGYYWLASDWSNLYLSCINCNQSTAFEILDVNDPTRIIRKTGGKANQFALSDEQYRINRHDKDLAEEEPYRLLIDPCKDDPETLLEFLDNGVLRPRQQSGFEYEKALYSIDVYALQRDMLVRTRKQRYLQIMDKINSVTKLLAYIIEDLQTGGNAHRHNDDKIQLNNDFLMLLDFLDVEKIPNEYIGLARQYIHPFLMPVYALKPSLPLLLKPSD